MHFPQFIEQCPLPAVLPLPPVTHPAESGRAAPWCLCIPSPAAYPPATTLTAFAVIVSSYARLQPCCTKIAKAAAQLQRAGREPHARHSTDGVGGTAPCPAEQRQPTCAAPSTQRNRLRRICKQLCRPSVRAGPPNPALALAPGLRSLRQPLQNSPRVGKRLQKGASLRASGMLSQGCRRPRARGLLAPQHLPRQSLLLFP